MYIPFVNKIYVDRKINHTTRGGEVSLAANQNLNFERLSADIIDGIEYGFVEYVFV